MTQKKTLPFINHEKNIAPLFGEMTLENTRTKAYIHTVEIKQRFKNRGGRVATMVDRKFSR